MGRRAHIEHGERFGRLVVLIEAEKVSGQRRVLCRCDCGNEKVVFVGHLRRGRTRSCGCLHNEQFANIKRKHGGRYTAEYRVWCNMIRRCTPGTRDAKNYGDRGIRVCARWRSSFVSFVADVGPRPSPEHSLDRYPDNDGDYERGNVRWATRREQMANRRNSRMLAVAGATKAIAEWARETGIPHHVIRDRVNRGWSPVRAVSEPVRHSA